MPYKVQPEFVCENCIKCGSRPVIDQNKNTWIVRCPNDECNNSVSNNIADFKAWDRKNKPTIALNNEDNGLQKKSI